MSASPGSPSRRQERGPPENGGPIAARFLFRQARSDEEFDRLNELILRAAESNPGYRGREWWRNDDGDLAVVYWWDSLEALRTFAADPVHREAKQRWDEWYEGYRIEISRLLKSYGRGRPPGGGADPPGRE